MGIGLQIKSIRIVCMKVFNSSLLVGTLEGSFAVVSKPVFARIFWLERRRGRAFWVPAVPPERFVLRLLERFDIEPFPDFSAK